MRTTALALLLFLIVSVSSHGQVGYYNYKESGISVGYLRSSADGYSISGGGFGVVINGLTEVSIVLESEGGFSSTTFVLAYFPVKQGRKSAPVSIGMGAGYSSLGSYTSSISVGLFSMEQNYRYEFHENVFLLQSAAAGYTITTSQAYNSGPVAGGCLNWCWHRRARSFSGRAGVSL